MEQLAWGTPTGPEQLQADPLQLQGILYCEAALEQSAEPPTGTEIDALQVQPLVLLVVF